MADLVTLDRELASAVLSPLWAAGQECRVKLDGSIVVGPSRRLERKRRAEAARAAISAAEAKRARKAAKFAGAGR